MTSAGLSTACRCWLTAERSGASSRDIDTAEGAFPYEAGGRRDRGDAGHRSRSRPVRGHCQAGPGRGYRDGGAGRCRQERFVPGQGAPSVRRGLARGAVRRWSHPGRARGWLSASIGTPSAIGFAANGCVLSDASQGLGRGRVGREEGLDRQFGQSDVDRCAKDRDRAKSANIPQVEQPERHYHPRFVEVPEWRFGSFIARRGVSGELRQQRLRVGSFGARLVAELGEGCAPATARGWQSAAPAPPGAG